MEQDFYYSIASNKVAHEIIDGEAIVIHFDTGNYYSLGGISAQLWQWFTAGARRQQILNAFQDLQPDQIQSLDGFIDSLLKEQILEKIIADAGLQPASPLSEYGAPFETPKFSKYNDMQNLLMSDPIHDVDETGWPNLPPDGR